MKIFEELQVEQEELNNNLLKCPKCGVICRWQEIIKGYACVGCYYKSKEKEESRLIPPQRDMKKDNLEEIYIINWNKKEEKYKMNFAMLLAYANQTGGSVNIKIGAYECILKVIQEKECEKCGQNL